MQTCTTSPVNREMQIKPQWTIQLIPTEGATIKREKKSTRRNNCCQGCWKRGISVHYVYIYLFMAALGLCCWIRAFSVATSGGNSLDVSIQALEHTGSVTVAHRLSIAPQNLKSPQTQEWTRVLHRQTDSNHWTTTPHNSPFALIGM